MGVVLCAHSIRGELYIQRNTNREVATTSPFYNKPHWSQILFEKAASGTTFTSWSQHHFVAIGKPEQYVRKASHCGSKQQQRSPDKITVLFRVLTHLKKSFSILFQHLFNSTLKKFNTIASLHFSKFLIKQLNFTHCINNEEVCLQ